MTVAPDEPAGPADRELDDLIVRHLDGGLDPAGQRRLADLLASSAEARRTLEELTAAGGSISVSTNY